MKRTVKRWIAVAGGGRPCEWCIRSTNSEESVGRLHPRLKVVKCTITYDDCKPAKKKVRHAKP